MQTYTIRPFKWTYSPPMLTDPADDDYGTHNSDSAMGGYFVYEHTSGRVVWGYCFDEYYDEATMPADSVKEAKKSAFEHWKSRILPALVCKKMTAPPNETRRDKEE